MAFKILTGFAAASLVFCPVLGSQEPVVSTAPPARVQSPLFLTIARDSDSSRVGLDYRIRWDFSDLRSLRPGLGFLYSGVKALYNWDITENTRLEYYGLRTNPWRLIISREKKNGVVPPPPPTGESAVVTPAAVQYRKKVRFSISPLVDDIKRNLDDDLRGFLLRSSLSGLSPDWEKAGDSGRKAFMKDVLSLGLWDSGLPLVKETGQGLEYISNDGKKAAPKK